MLVGNTEPSITDRLAIWWCRPRLSTTPRFGFWLMPQPPIRWAVNSDARTVRSSGGVDYHLRQILGSQLEPQERASISLQYRQAKAALSESAFKTVNQRIGQLHAALHAQPIALAMDQTARTSWEESVAPHVAGVPFTMSGQGQQSAIKIALAMNRHAGHAKYVTIEEPENHLSHTSLVS